MAERAACIYCALRASSTAEYCAGTSNQAASLEYLNGVHRAGVMLRGSTMASGLVLGGMGRLGTRGMDIVSQISIQGIRHPQPLLEIVGMLVGLFEKL